MQGKLRSQGGRYHAGCACFDCIVFETGPTDVGTIGMAPVQTATSFAVWTVPLAPARASLFQSGLPGGRVTNASGPPTAGHAWNRSHGHVGLQNDLRRPPLDRVRLGVLTGQERRFRRRSTPSSHIELGRRRTSRWSPTAVLRRGRRPIGTRTDVALAYAPPRPTHLVLRVERGSHRQHRAKIRHWRAGRTQHPRTSE